jgi:hypothetical protein
VMGWQAANEQAMLVCSVYQSKALLGQRYDRSN